MDTSYEFMWSMTSMTLLEVSRSDGEIIRCYFRSLDRNTGALTVSTLSVGASGENENWNPHAVRVEEIACR